MVLKESCAISFRRIKTIALLVHLKINYYLCKRMRSKECFSKFSKNLFWDVDMSQADMDKAPGQIVQRVLEYGEWNDWKLVLSYYGLDKIVNVCKKLRTLDPVCLSYICAISHTNKEDYRCYHTRQLNPTLWNS